MYAFFYRAIACVLCAVLSLLLSRQAAQAQPSDEPITFESLLEEMADRSRLTRTPDPVYTAHGASSYDRESQANNPDDGLFVELA